MARSVNIQLVTKKTPVNDSAFIHAEGCNYCRYMIVRYPITLLYQMKNFDNCKTKGVVSFLCWRSGVYQHPNIMKSCNPDLPLGRHVASTQISFVVLSSVHPGSRGGHCKKIILQRDQRWIFRLNAASSPSLNKLLSLGPFLDGFVSGGAELD